MLRQVPENEHEFGYKAQEFLGAAFCPKEPTRYLVTLAGRPDWCVQLWQHDVFKLHTQIALNIVDPLEGYTFQISECYMSCELNIVVTGPQTYRYLRIADSNN